MSKEKKPSQNKRGGAPGVLTLTVPIVSAVGAWIAYSNLFIDHDLPLPHALSAERETFKGETTGTLSYYADRHASGRPLVLIHSINAAGCAYEMRPIFEHYRASRPVYALELPGFGFSERSDRVYTPALFKQAILDFLTTVGNEPADVVALSLSNEFAALAAVARPDLFHTLAMISPSGFTARKRGRSSERASEAGTSNLFYRLFAFPLWGRAFYDLIATKRSIDFFLGQSFAGPVDVGLAEYAYLTAHQPGAHYAPLYFVSGMLFTRDIREVAYERLSMPVLALYDRDAFVRFDELPGMIERQAHWRAARIQPTRGLPHFEKPDETFQALDAFWSHI